jgi:hypothetical protein
MTTGRRGIAAELAESVLRTTIAFPHGRCGFAEIQIDRFIAHGVHGTSELAGNPAGLVIAIEFAHECAFASGPRACTSAASATTSCAASGGATPTISHFQTPFLNHYFKEQKTVKSLLHPFTFHFYNRLFIKILKDKRLRILQLFAAFLESQISATCFEFCPNGQGADWNATA